MNLKEVWSIPNENLEKIPRSFLRLNTEIPNPKTTINSRIFP